MVAGLEGQTSGVLATRYNLDGGGDQTYSSSPPVIVTAEGNHTVTFFSTDRAGNNEPIQSIQFVIDKTPPEAEVTFDPLKKDIVFSGLDNLSTSSGMTIQDADDLVVLTDQAGNTTTLTLKDKDRKRSLKAEIKSLAYNGQAVDLSKNLLHFDWLFNAKGILQRLNQQVESKKGLNALALYTLGKTLITGKDAAGQVNQILDGLVLLKIVTNKGDLWWKY